MRLPMLLITLTLLLSNTAYSDIIRFAHVEHEGQPRYGVVNGQTLTLINGDIFGAYRVSGDTIPLDKAALLPATTPSKIIAVGLHYKSHFGSTRGATTRLFSKLPSELTGHDEPVWLFSDGKNLHYEGELVFVIGKTANNISVAEAPDYIFGITAGNDVT